MLLSFYSLASLANHYPLRAHIHTECDVKWARRRHIHKHAELQAIIHEIEKCLLFANTRQDGGVWGTMKRFHCFGRICWLNIKQDDNLKIDVYEIQFMRNACGGRDSVWQLCSGLLMLAAGNLRGDASWFILVSIFTRHCYLTFYYVVGSEKMVSGWYSNCNWQRECS